MFADDTNLICDNHLWAENELLKVKEWCLADKLITNFDKREQIIFRNPQKKLAEETFELQNLSCVDHCKFLGVTLDQHCTFNFHIDNIVRKMTILLMMFRYLTKFLDEKNNDQFISYLHIPPSYLWCTVLGSCSRLPGT